MTQPDHINSTPDQQQQRHSQSSPPPRQPKPNLSRKIRHRPSHYPSPHRLHQPLLRLPFPTKHPRSRRHQPTNHPWLLHRHRRCLWLRKIDPGLGPAQILRAHLSPRLIAVQRPHVRSSTHVLAPVPHRRRRPIARPLPHLHRRKHHLPASRLVPIPNDHPSRRRSRRHPRLHRVVAGRVCDADR